jgi:hypothetical protein
VDNNWVKGRQLRPGQSVSFEVFVSSSQEVVLEGKIVMTTKLGGVQKTHDFPLNCRVFLHEVAIDNAKDVEVGRVMIGENVSYSWLIHNFGNEFLKY